MAYLKGFLESRGTTTTVVDVGTLGPPFLEPDYSAEEVASLAGFDLPALLRERERGHIMEVMGKGAAILLLDLFEKGKVDGALGLGGNQGTSICASAMKALPLGLPKFLVSTVASGDVRPFLGHKDIAIIFSVGDMLGGPNALTRSVLENAASALLGMIHEGSGALVDTEEKTIGITELGNTEKGASHAVKLLRGKGYEVLPFHASGAGGSAMEELVEAGSIKGVFDLTPHELAEEVIGEGVYVPVRPGRMTAASKKGIPQVVSTGGLEYLCFGPRESIPSRLRHRKIYMHNPMNANLKLSRREMGEVGSTMAQRLNLSRGPVAVMIPLRGWSVYGSEGGPFHDPKGNKALVDALKESLMPDIQVEEIDAHINDHCFIERCIQKLVNFMEAGEIGNQ